MEEQLKWAILIQSGGKKYDMNTKLSTEVAELSERNNVCEFEKKWARGLWWLFVWLLLSSSISLRAHHWFFCERFNPAGGQSQTAGRYWEKMKGRGEAEWREGGNQRWHRKGKFVKSQAGVTACFSSRGILGMWAEDGSRKWGMRRNLIWGPLHVVVM